MSGVNQVASAAASGATNDPVIAVLQALAADAAALSSMVQEGDVVSATVLPFNGITDLIEVFGLQVAASLPPGVHPGDTVTLEVQGFQGDQILVKLTDATPPADGGIRPPPLPATGDLELTPTPVPVVVDPETLPASATPVPVRPGMPAQLGVPPPLIGPLPPPVSPRTPAPIPGAQGALGPGARAPLAPPTADSLSVEARLALNRAALPIAQKGGGPAERGGALGTPGAGSPLARPRAGGTPIDMRPFTRPAYLPITPKSASKGAPAPIPGAPSPIRGAAVAPASAAAATRPAAIVPSALLADPAALLRTLRIPVSPTSLAFAKLVTAHPEQVATALRALETALPDSSDSRIQTLRTLASFIGNLNPKSPTFTTQVSSYLSHVVEGPEAKLFALVRGDAAAPQPAEQPPAAAPSPGSPARATSAGSAQPSSTATSSSAVTAATQPPVPANPSAAAAQVVERTAAASSDLKTQLLTVLATSGNTQALGDAGTAVVQNALTALVTQQLTTLGAQQLQPGQMSFTIPIVVDRQQYAAKVKINRDKPDGTAKLTSDDFHISFILDTPRLGTVSIDVHSVGRSVSVAVKTEREIVATTFKDSLSKLGERLESMRYNVKSLDSGTLPPRGTELAAAAEEADAADASAATSDTRHLVDGKA